MSTESAGAASVTDQRPLPGTQKAGDGAQRASSPAGVRPARKAADWRKRLEITFLSGPAILVFVSFVIFPVILAAYYGFFRWKGFGPATDFVGWGNYAIIFADSAFHEVLAHNGIILVLSLVIQLPIALILALLLNQKIKGRSVIRVLIFVPYIISEVIVGIGWGLMLQTNGAVNDLLENIGLGAFKADWLSDPEIAMGSLMLIISWKYIGFAVILFLAGLQGIPEELSEAAAIDGASYWQIQRHITLPLLGPTLRTWAFLSIIGSLQLFDLVFIIWGQYVASTAGVSTMATYMVANGRTSGNFGFGSAVAVVMFLISLVIALTYQRFVLRRDTAGALTERQK